MAGCSDPPNVARASISSWNDTYVTYMCFDGYGIQGSATVYCNGGVWDSTPNCLVAWVRDADHTMAPGNSTITITDSRGTIEDWTLFLLAGAAGCFVLFLCAGLLLCWLHQCGCFDGPAVGFGGDYVYTDRRLCYWGDLNVKFCNYICSCCKRRCCRYIRKKTHGKVHFQAIPTPEEVALLKLKMKRKKKRKFGPVPLCLRAGRCLLGCLLCCCRKKKLKGAEFTDIETAEDTPPVIIPAVAPLIPAVAPVIPKPGLSDPKVIDVKPAEVFVPPVPVNWSKKPEEEEKELEKKREKKKPEPVGPPLLAIKEPPKKPKKEEVKEEPKPVEKKPEPVGPPLMIIKAPPKKNKKAEKKKQEMEKKKEEKKTSSTAGNIESFSAAFEGVERPFGNVDIRPPSLGEDVDDPIKSVLGKGNKVATSAFMDEVTKEKYRKRKVAKWNDITDAEVWQAMPQQDLYSPEAPVKPTTVKSTTAKQAPLKQMSLKQTSGKPTNKISFNLNLADPEPPVKVHITEDTPIKLRKSEPEYIPLANLFTISEPPKKKKSTVTQIVQTKTEGGGNIGMPTSGQRQTMVKHQSMFGVPFAH